MTTYHLAPYACDPRKSRGRRYPEDPPRERDDFQRDRDRILHSDAFRRLEYKTQVFVNHEGDYYRTRLTHSLEVAQLARSICRALDLNEDLGETVALSHDIGHTPFGHAGENALGPLMKKYGGFDHNSQALRVVTFLERRYGGFDGLNLTWESLEGLIKHNGPFRKGKVPALIADYNRIHDLDLFSFASAEAQAAAISDDISYDSHDLDDGLRAGLFTLEDVRQVSFVDEVLSEVYRDFPGLSGHRLAAEVVRRLINRMVVDVLAESRRRLGDSGVRTPDDIRNLNHPVVAFSDEMARKEGALKEFLFERMYRHYTLVRMNIKAEKLLTEMFVHFHTYPKCLPADWRDRAGDAGSAACARAVADYIAGMTDRYAYREHARLFDMAEKS